MKSIIAGQYIDYDSALHRLDPRAKLLLLTVFVIFLLSGQSFLNHIGGVIILTLATILSKVPFKTVFRFLSGSRFFIWMILIVNLAFTPGRDGYNWWIFGISSEGAANGFLFSLRMIALVWSAALLSWTTSPISVADGFEKIGEPLKKIGIPVRDISTMMLLALRFLPTLLRDYSELKFAQTARGAEFNKGNYYRRIKAIVPLIIPLFIGAFRRADATAIALTVRGYVSDGHRTSLYPLVFRKTDALVSAFSLCILTGNLIFTF
jgi:energy-coupling factor transport system permease protein